MVLRDLAQAVSDLGLVLVLTAALLAVLFVAGWGLRQRALKLQIRAENTERLLTKRERETVRLHYAASFQQGISTELFGAVFTTLAFGVVLLIFQQYQDVQNRKAELILQMGSPDNAFAIEAVRQLRALGWLQNGMLHNPQLWDANLQNANLEGANMPVAIFAYANLHSADLSLANFQSALFVLANLQGARLSSTNLQDANLSSANLRDAILSSANLRGAFFSETNLQDANLSSANLQDAGLEAANLENANLRGANLEGTNLRDVNLQGANLERTIFSDRTLLPDSPFGNPNFWTPETDMTRYTNPDHPDFWQPDWVTEEAADSNG